MTEAYQSFDVPYPRFPLATFPSPLERASRLEAALRDEGYAHVPRLYLKRDDALSLGMGGNKTRNLEFSLGEALEQGATDVVTAGRPQSNHCRLTAAACARAGLRAHLVFTGAPTDVPTGNQLLDHILGASMYYTESADRAARAELVADVAARIEREGGCPYVIPVGGSDSRGALGHALLALELAHQLELLGERLTAVVLATATGGTQAGLLAGLSRLGIATPVYGFAVAKSAAELSADVRRLADDVAAAIGGTDTAAGDVRVSGVALGTGYGAPTSDAQQAIDLLARSEGVFTDPVYSGKGLAGLLQMVRAGRFVDEDAVVFIHTGGAPALFA